MDTTERLTELKNYKESHHMILKMTRLDSQVLFLTPNRSLKLSVPYTFHMLQFSLVAQSCPTLCDPMSRSTPGLPVHHQLPEFTFSRVQLCATHRRQPTRLPRPWDSPGKNTGVGCHFLLQCMKVKSESEVAQSCLTPTRLLRPWDFPGKSTGVGRQCLLWGSTD